MKEPQKIFKMFIHPIFHLTIFLLWGDPTQDQLMKILISQTIIHLICEFTVSIIVEEYQII